MNLSLSSVTQPTGVVPIKHTLSREREGGGCGAEMSDGHADRNTQTNADEASSCEPRARRCFAGVHAGSDSSSTACNYAVPRCTHTHTHRERESRTHPISHHRREFA